MSEMDWKPLDTCPYGRTIIVGREEWSKDGEVTTVHWKNEGAKMVDLSNWMDPPTHWLDGIPLVPPPPERTSE